MSDFLYGLSLGAMQIVRFSLVYIGLIFFLFLSLIDIPFVPTGEIRQAFLLIGIYFWTLYRPNLLPYSLVFSLGIALDLLSGGLLGLNALCFMVLAIIVRGQRRFLLGQSWQMVWVGFFVAVFTIQTFQTGIYGLVSSDFSPLWVYISNIAIAGLFYPLFHSALMALARFLNE